MHLERIPLNVKQIITSLFVVSCLLACESNVVPKENGELSGDISQKVLPVLGRPDIDENGDEMDHTIEDFTFINQFNDTVTQEKYKGKVYISNFIFTTCPGICPIMTDQMARVQDSIKGTGVEIISHTVNPSHDSTSVLLAYGKKKGADFSNWNFVTGTPYQIYKIAASYEVVAKVDSTQEIPFVHSEKFVLIDTKKRIRGYYNGTDSTDVNKMIKEIRLLIKE